MNTAAIYHRPESEYAFLYTADTFRIRLRTCKDDVKKFILLVAILIRLIHKNGIWKKYQ